MSAETTTRRSTWQKRIANIVIFGTLAGVLSACYVYPAPYYRPHPYYYGSYGYYR
jgi:hypothetical protein